jgi:D-aminoacyl-tRNA deacylase
MASVVVMISDADPVADAVAKVWGTLPATDAHVDGAPIRRLNESMIVLRRSGTHIHDERVDLRLPHALRDERPTLVFPSIHRSRENVRSLTVHPLGNPGPRADLGGRPRTLVPADPARMVSALRLLDERSELVGIPTTYEATHHGPELGLPAFFVEIGSGEHTAAALEAVRILADVIPRVAATPGDRVALAVGGGHYVPHFTDLALHRKWAFGHLLSRHSLEELDRETAAQAYRLSEGAEGVVYSRAQDANHPALEGIGPRLRDQDAAPLLRGTDTTATDAARSVSGT